MADHWKSLANLLGAPGVDEPEPDIQGSESSMDANREVVPPSKLEPMVSAGGEEEASSGNELRADVPDSPIATHARATPAETRLEPEKIKEPEKLKGPEKPEKVRRKSSWESLASMFNVKIDRSQPPVAEKPIAVESEEVEIVERPQGKLPRDTSLSIFSADAADATDDANPALESMFAGAPRESSADWEPQPRIVDDLGWDDDVAATGDREESKGIEASEDAPRRGRRRRRGRRGRGAAPDIAPPSVEGETPWEFDESDVGEPDDDWQEPASFGSESELEEVEGLDELSVEEAGEGEDVVRRSTRRRRRGRGRGRERDEVASEGDVPSHRADAARSELYEEDLERMEEAEDVAPIARPARGSRDRGDDEQGSRGKRRRGRPSEERTREAAVRSRESVPTEDAMRSKVASLPEEREPGFGFDEGDDDSARDTTRHRNIPTWAESVQSLVEANIENRRRSDNRGGPRGRPRGRR